MGPWSENMLVLPLTIILHLGASCQLIEGNFVSITGECGVLPVMLGRRQTCLQYIRIGH